MKILSLRSVFLLQWLTVLNGLLEEPNFQSSAAFVEVMVRSFGLAEGGHVEVDFNVTNGAEFSSSSFFLFLVANENQYQQWYKHQIEDLNSRSDTYYEQVQQLCNAPSMYRKRLQSHGSLLFQVPDTDRYSCIGIQCFPDQSVLSSSLKIELLNPTSEGCCTGHLSIESVMDINIAMIEFIVFLVMLASLLFVFLTAEKDSVKFVHAVLFFTVLVGIISALVEYFCEKNRNEHGSRNDGLENANFVFRAFERSCFKFSVFLLGLGWDFVRPDILRHEKIFVTILFVFFLTISVSQVSCMGQDYDSRTIGCRSLELIEYVFSGFLLLSTIISLNYSVSQLRAIISNLNWYPSMPMLYARLRQYNQFRNIYLFLLLIPTVVYMIEVTMLSWRQKWVGSFMRVLVKLVFMFYAGAIFAPLNSNALCRPFNGSFNSN